VPSDLPLLPFAYDALLELAADDAATIERRRHRAVTATRIGFVGVGHMGGTMARRLLAAGYPVYATSRSRERAQALREEGVAWRDTPQAVAESADVVLTSIPDDHALDDVACGPDGILSGLAPGGVWADMSTVSPGASRAIAAQVRAQGAHMLDAPVSGGVPQAAAGTLTIMVGGTARAYQRVEPILRELGTPSRIGPNGHGLALKRALNIGLAVQMLAFGEGLRLAEASGVDRKHALEVMLRSPMGSPMLKARAPLIFDVAEEAWFGMVLAAARDLDVPLSSASDPDHVLMLAHALDSGRRDLAALFELLEQVATDAGTQPLAGAGAGDGATR
jgi:3-hydroxyisobutyrate dehydrogenase-like beta-hydroxyacid dehydrogenase